MFRKFRPTVIAGRNILMVLPLITAAGFIMIREAQEDTVLHIPNPPGVEGSTAVPIPKGIQVVVDMVGVRKFCATTTFDCLPANCT